MTHWLLILQEPTDLWHHLRFDPIARKQMGWGGIQNGKILG